ncbi:MAG: Galactose-1-phosphate uridylyltransferase [Candidatus Moranbacteria bacterium GW2011_GWC2_37_8]|nr:MAG: Galactose-1-phosphate uridylyltransferase [Candidatus Moranbacteria bacterium GW2011_GWC2_37_8]KKQ62764.1 MAG: galactose-1-phosphate uridylyltransferase, UDPglucose-hexose-1-phosphate uridylyltransferase [Parcubacteria group bacterium GW2011_GWC1_38_22]
MNILINGSNEIEPKKKIDAKAASELRQDLVSGDWVVIATGRAKRPDEFGNFQRSHDDKGIATCLFEDPVASGQEPDVLIYERPNDDWSLRVFPNKYPAFSNGKSRNVGEGPYTAVTGHGFHEIVVTRDHFRHLAVMDIMEVAEVFDAYQERFLALMNKKDVNYIAIFHNHGKEVGASIPHPHSQIMAIPVVSPYVQLELDGASKFHKSNRHCVFCTMAEYESESEKRVVFENEEFIAYCPFASRAAFEVHVMPKKHSPYFERITDAQKIKLAEVFSKALGAIYKALNDPPYNFYIHSAPCDGKDYPHFHWHIEILPHTSTWAGFELDTGIEISTIQPEVAAEYLRKQF